MVATWLPVASFTTHVTVGSVAVVVFNGTDRCPQHMSDSFQVTHDRFSERSVDCAEHFGKGRYDAVV